MIALAAVLTILLTMWLFQTEFYKRLDQLKKEVPEDVKLGIALDQAKFVKKSISEVEETLIISWYWWC